MAKSGGDRAASEGRTRSRLARLEKQLKAARRDADRRARQLRKAEAKVQSLGTELLAAAEGAPEALAKRAKERAERAGVTVAEASAGVLSRAAGAAAGAAGLAAGAAGLAAGVAGKAVGVVADVTTTITRREDAANGTAAAAETDGAGTPAKTSRPARRPRTPRTP